MAGLNHQVPGQLDPRIGSTLSRARSFQNIPIQVKKPTSIRKVIDIIMVTVRNTSLADNGFMARLAALRSPKPEA
jgi:hypothetical protein